MTNVHAQPGILSPLAGAVLLPRLAKNWGWVLLRGIVAIAFGVSAFIWPGITLLSLTFLWGAYAIADGVFALGAALFGQTDDIAPRWWLVVIGIIGILAGVVTFVSPGITMLTLLLYIAIWAIIVGLLQIWGAIRLRKEIDNEWLLILGGVVLIAYGIVLMTRPDVGVQASIWTIGSFSIVLGFIYGALAFWLKRYNEPVGAAHP